MQQQYHDSILMARKQRNLYTGSPQEWKQYTSSRKLAPFAFEPNAMTFSDWRQMGFSEKNHRK